MSRPRKFQPGTQLYTFAAFAHHMEEGRHFYFHHKFTHNGWARGWQVGSVLTWIAGGYIRLAELVEVPDGSR